MTEPVSCFRKIIRHYPVRRLPADLSAHFNIDALVNVTLEAMEISPGMLIEEKVYDYRDGQMMLISQRSYTSQ